MGFSSFGLRLQFTPLALLVPNSLMWTGTIVWPSYTLSLELEILRSLSFHEKLDAKFHTVPVFLLLLLPTSFSARMRLCMPEFGFQGTKTQENKRNLQFLCNTIKICQEFILFSMSVLLWTLFNIFKLAILYIFSIFLNRCVCKINCPEFSRHPLLEVRFLLKFGIHENWAVEYAPSS